MTAIRFDQLPAKAREQIERTLDEPRRRTKSRAGISDRVPCPGHCGCGEAFPTAHAWEIHAKASGHGVWSIDLDEDI